MMMNRTSIDHKVTQKYGSEVHDQHDGLRDLLPLAVRALHFHFQSRTKKY